MFWSSEESWRLFQTQAMLNKHQPHARPQAGHAGSISSDPSAALRGTVSGGEAKGQRSPRLPTDMEEVD